MLSPSLNFSTQREKSQVGSAICLPGLKGFLLGASGVKQWELPQPRGEKEGVSPRPQLCSEGEPTPPPHALSLAA